SLIAFLWCAPRNRRGERGNRSLGSNLANRLSVCRCSCLPPTPKRFRASGRCPAAASINGATLAVAVSPAAAKTALLRSDVELLYDLAVALKVALQECRSLRGRPRMGC